MAWLLHNYFLPTLNPSTVAQPQPIPLRPLDPLLKQYKSLLKMTTRDTSLRTRYKGDITSILRDIERWVAETKVTASIEVGEIGWDTDANDAELKERWALDRLCDGLLG